ncbi:hypothetical protein ABW19_dt0210067 [Dactylella cylindrospora]|nr:hypothetical protein ABW19_dt0210067 [Dactylella cylindrospora]
MSSQPLLPDSISALVDLSEMVDIREPMATSTPVMNTAWNATTSASSSEGNMNSQMDKLPVPQPSLPNTQKGIKNEKAASQPNPGGSASTAVSSAQGNSTPTLTLRDKNGFIARPVGHLADAVAEANIRFYQNQQASSLAGKANMPVAKVPQTPESKSMSLTPVSLSIKHILLIAGNNASGVSGVEIAAPSLTDTQIPAGPREVRTPEIPGHALNSQNVSVTANPNQSPMAGNDMQLSQVINPAEAQVTIKIEEPMDEPMEPAIRFPGECYVISDDEEDEVMAENPAPEKVRIELVNGQESDSRNAAPPQSSQNTQSLIAIPLASTIAPSASTPSISFQPRRRESAPALSFMERNGNLPYDASMELGVSTNAAFPDHNTDEEGSDMDMNIRRGELPNTQPSSKAYQSENHGRSRSTILSPAHTRTRSAAPAAYRNGGEELDDMEMVHRILNDKSRKAQILESQMEMMKKVVWEIDEKLETICEKNQEIKSLRDRCNRLQDAVDNHRQKQAPLHQEIEKLRHQVQAMADEIKRNKMEFVYCENRAKQKQELSAQVITRLRGLHDENAKYVSEMSDKYIQLKDEFDSLVREKDMLLKDISDRDSVVRAIQVTTRSSTEKILELRKEHSELREKNNMLQDLLNNKEAQIASEKAANADLRVTLKQMNSEITGIRAAMDTHHKSLLEEIEKGNKLMNEYGQIQEEEIKRSQEVMHKLLQNTGDTDSELFEALRRTHTGLDQKWNELQGALSNLREVQDVTSKAHIEKVEKWKTLKLTMGNKLEFQEQELREKQEKITDLESTILQLNSEISKLKDLNQCLLDTTKVDRESHASKVAELSKALGRAESERTELTVQKSLIEASIENTARRSEAEKDTLKDEAGRYKGLLAAADTRHQAEVEKLCRERDAAISKAQELSNLQTKFEELSIDNAGLQREAAEKQNRVSEMEKTLECAQRELGNKETQLKDLSSQLKEATEKQDELQRELDVTTVQNTAFTEGRHALDKELLSNMERIEALDSQLSGKVRAITRLSEDLEAAESKLKDLGDKYDAEICNSSEKSTEMRELRKILAEKESVIDELTRDLKDTKQQVDKLKAKFPREQESQPEEIEKETKAAGTVAIVSQNQDPTTNEVVKTLDNGEATVSDEDNGLPQFRKGVKFLKTKPVPGHLTKYGKIAKKAVIGPRKEFVQRVQAMPLSKLLDLARQQPGTDQNDKENPQQMVVSGSGQLAHQSLSKDGENGPGKGQKRSRDESEAAVVVAGTPEAPTGGSSSGNQALVLATQGGIGSQIVPATQFPHLVGNPGALNQGASISASANNMPAAVPSSSSSPPMFYNHAQHVQQGGKRKTEDENVTTTQHLQAAERSAKRNCRSKRARN